MKQAYRILLTLLASVATIFAQGGASGVRVEISFPQNQFLPDEELNIAVKIVNFSGQTLHLGASDDWLHFSVDSKESLLAIKRGDPPVQGEFSLESSLAGTKRVNLTPYFDCSRPGKYRITATVKIAQWNA